jgi:hypothetical protein
MSILYKATYSHFTSEKKFPTPLILLWCHRYGLQENIPLDDELSRHEHVAREIIVGVSQGCDMYICEKGLSIVWQHQHRQVLTLKLNANQMT